jgi:hypothetical protein
MLEETKKTENHPSASAQNSINLPPSGTATGGLKSGKSKKHDLRAWFNNLSKKQKIGLCLLVLVIITALGYGIGIFFLSLNRQRPNLNRQS